MWQIANPERWRQDCRKRPEADDGERLAGGLSFCLLAKKPAGETVLRRLGLGLGSGCGTEEYNYRMYSFLKPVEETAFDGTFPTASLEYRDRALPVQVRLKAASPFVPYDERTSGTPGIFLTFSVYNPSGEPVEISLTGKLRSLVNAGPEGRGQRNQVTQSGGYTSLVMSSGRRRPRGPRPGRRRPLRGGRPCHLAVRRVPGLYERVCGPRQSGSLRGILPVRPAAERRSARRLRPGAAGLAGGRRDS